MMDVKPNSASMSSHALQAAGVIKSNTARARFKITDLDGLKNLTREATKQLPFNIVDCCTTIDSDVARSVDWQMVRFVPIGDIARERR
jgi:hypothetical protein